MVLSGSGSLMRSCVQVSKPPTMASSSTANVQAVGVPIGISIVCSTGSEAGRIAATSTPAARSASARALTCWCLRSFVVASMMTSRPIPRSTSGAGVSATPRHARPDHRVGEGPLLACFCWNWRRWANVERLMQYLGPAVVVIVLSAARGAPDTLGLTATAVLSPTMVSFTFHATNTDACDSTDTSALRSARPVPPIDGRVQSCAAWLQPRLMEVSMLNPRLAQTVAMWVILAAGSVWQGAVVSSGSIDDLCGGRTVDARDLPSFVPETSRCAAAGLVIRYGGAGVTIPTQVGDGVAAFAERGSLLVERTSRGIEISTEDVADPTEAAVGSLAATECTSVTWATKPYVLGSNYSWHLYNASGIPTGMTTATVSAEFSAAFVNWTAMEDNCGFPDVIPRSASYAGSTSVYPPNINSGSCNSNDGRNVVGFGAQSSNALTCVWYSGGTVSNADIELNSSSTWFLGGVPTGCSGKYSVENTATHEFGHVLGFGDVSDSLQTMYGTGILCSRAKTTPACGDYLVARNKYSTSGTC